MVGGGAVGLVWAQAHGGVIGAAGRLYMAGSTQDVLRARDEIARVLGEVQGREQLVANR